MPSELLTLQARALSGAAAKPLEEWLSVACRLMGVERGAVIAAGQGARGQICALRGGEGVPSDVVEEARRRLEGAPPCAGVAWEFVPLVADGETEAIWCGPTPGGVLPPVVAEVGAHIVAYESRRERQGRVTKATRDERRSLQGRLDLAELQLQSYERLRTFEELLQVCEDQGELTEVVEIGLEQLFHDASPALYVVGPHANILVRRDNLGGEVAEVVTMDDCIAMRRGRAHRTGPGQPLRCPHLPPGVQNAVCVPLIGKSETFGMLHVAARDEGEVSQERWRKIETVAATAAHRSAVAMANIRLAASLFDQTRRDTTTGLFNRRYLEEELASMVRRATREETPLSLVIVDVAGYATIAEVFGMHAGAVVLAEMAKLLQQHAREGDLPCRIGRELFALALPGADVEGARVRTEALLTAIGATRLHHGGRALGRLACCAGVAVAPRDGRDAPSLIDAADRAMVHARATGQTCVVVDELAETEGARAPADPGSLRPFGALGGA